MSRDGTTTVVDNMSALAVAIENLETSHDLVQREAWSALQVIRKTIEEVGPAGTVLPAQTGRRQPRAQQLTREAEVLANGIRKIADGRLQQ